MTHAFDDILQRRARRRALMARAAYLAKRSGRWLIALAATTLFVVVVAGFAEARADVNSSFDWPWKWLNRLDLGGDRPIAPITGALLVLYCGGWFTVLGVALLRMVLGLGYGPLAIARTVLDEALRNKTVIVLLALLLIALAAWPYSTAAASLEVRQPLRYQIQAFLSFSSMVTAVLLGAVTILFAAHSVSTDINVRRTGDVFVKPIGRVVYLLGKWIGVIALMATILAVQTLLVWGVSRLWLASTYAMDEMDAAAVTEQVLVARGEAWPMPPEPFQVRAEEELSRLIRDRPDFVAQRGALAMLGDLIYVQRSEFLQIPYGTRKQYKFTGLGRARDRGKDIEARITANREQIAEQLSELLGQEIPPSEINLMSIAPFARELGLDIKEGLLQWRFKFSGINTYASAWGQVDLRINGQSLPAPLTYTIDRVQVQDLPASYVDENGELILEVGNIYPDSLERTRALQFDTDTWLQIYHIEGHFAPNLIRGSMVHLARLAFLAMLGVITGALWSFPVAATFSLSIWLLAAGGSWLQETLSTQLPATTVEALDVGVNFILLPIIRLLASFLARYGTVDIAGSLVDGRYIPYSAVLGQVIWVDVIWMGLLLGIGGYLFWRREIARVQV